MWERGGKKIVLSGFCGPYGSLFKRFEVSHRSLEDNHEYLRIMLFLLNQYLFPDIFNTFCDLKTFMDPTSYTTIFSIKRL